jgi:ribosomal protein L18
MENIMKLFAALFTLMSLSTQVLASGTDEDLAAIKAHDKAVKESNAKDAARSADRKRQESDFKRKQDTQTANAVRPLLGKAAEGKSDEEVVRMFEERAKQGDKNKPDEGAIRAKSDAQTRSVTGRSLQDMQTMSDAELDKAEAALLKQYGGKK